MSASPDIRQAQPADLPVLVDIYNHYVLNSHVTFDTQPVDVEARRPWLESFGDAGPYRLFVACHGREVVGYASSQPFRHKPAYRTSVETTVYLSPCFVGRGIARVLYGRLLGEIAREPLHRAYAGIAQPNDASVALHEALGFKLVGTYHEVGYKFDRYWDVSWYEKPLTEQ